MTRGTYLVLAMAAIAYLAICAVMFAIQRSFLYYPQPRTVTMPGSTMTLPVDGADVVVTIRPHDGAKAIIYFGGNAEDVSLNLDEFSEAFPDHALFLMHYRGYGGSTGSPRENAIHADAEALFREVHASHPDVAVIGRSLGTGVAVRLASRQPVSRLILVTPYDSMSDVAAPAFPWLPVRLLMRDRYESGKCAPDVTVPTTIFAAEYDEVIPRSSTERLAGRFGDGVATMTTVPGVGHNDIGADGRYLELIRQALR